MSMTPRVRTFALLAVLVWPLVLLNVHIGI